MERWDDIHTFHYTGMSFDLARGVASFDYLAQGVTSKYPFTDLVTFPLPERRPDAKTLRVLERVLELLYVAVGAIYYKSMAPESVVLGTLRLAPAAQRWALRLFRSGLAEFAYRWQLPHVLDLDLAGEACNTTPTVSEVLTDDRPPLVALGGGKDSIVSLEALKAAGLRPVVFTVQRQPTPLLCELMALAHVPSLTIRRTVDRRLTDLLNTGGARIGHVPVTAINSLMGVAAAVLHGLGPVVMSSERSASSGNLVWRGREVNHQWSKGLEAEALLRDALGGHAGLSNACFSLLRGMSELHIAKLFAATTTYDQKVTSCNYAFRMGGNRVERWCNDCAKCRFVYLALAPFMDRARLISIFGHDLLDDPRHLEGYRELLGLTGHKPWECVGEFSESRVALRLLAEEPSWTGARLLGALCAQMPSWPTEQEAAAVFAADRPRFASPACAEALTALQTAASRPMLRD
ncbi:MAG: hypothetical protein WBR33_19370 [Pseudonocardiaceae bacterium]